MKYLIFLSVVLLAGCRPPSFESKLTKEDIKACRLQSDYCACVGARAMQQENNGTQTTEQLNGIRSSAMAECEIKNRDDKVGWSTGVNMNFGGYFLSLFLRIGQTIND